MSDRDYIIQEIKNIFKEQAQNQAAPPATAAPADDAKKVRLFKAWWDVWSKSGDESTAWRGPAMVTLWRALSEDEKENWNNPAFQSTPLSYKISLEDFKSMVLDSGVKKAAKPSGILQQLAGKDLLRAPGAFKYKGIDFSIKFNPKNMTIKAAGTQSSFTFHYGSIDLNVYEAKVVNSGGVANLKMGIWINKQKAQVNNRDLEKWLPKLLAKKQVSIQAAGKKITIKPDSSNKAIDLAELEPPKPKPAPPRPKPKPTPAPPEPKPKNKKESEGLCGMNFRIDNVRDFERQIVQTMVGVSCEQLELRTNLKINNKYNYKLYGDFLTAIDDGIQVKNTNIKDFTDRLKHYKKNVIPSANLQSYLLARAREKAEANKKKVSVLRILGIDKQIRNFMDHFDEKSGIVSLYVHDFSEYKVLNFAIFEMKENAKQKVKAGSYPVVFTSEPNSSDIANQFITKGLKDMEFFREKRKMEDFSKMDPFFGYEKSAITKLKMNLVGLHKVVRKYIMTYNAALKGKIPGSNIATLDNDRIKKKGIELLEIYKGRLEHLIRALHKFEEKPNSKTLHKLAKASASIGPMFKIIDDVVY